VAPNCPVCQAEQRLQHNGRLQWKPEKRYNARIVRVELEQAQKAHRTVNNDCLVHHWTVRWPHLSELQRSNPNGWVTWLAHQIVSGGAPDYSVRPSTEIPPTTTLQGIQVFSHCIQYKSSILHSKTQNKRSNPLPSSESLQTISD
jgi:hypothetical protein